MNTKATETANTAHTISGNAQPAKALAKAPSISVERQRDILIESVKAYLMRHGRNELIASDVAFTDMTNAGHTFQSALCAIYLSGLKHGAGSGTTP